MSKKAVFKKLKLQNITGEAKSIVIKKAIARKEELDEVSTQESEHKHSAFIIRQKNNFYYCSFAGSLMRSLRLRLLNTITTILFQVASLLCIKKESSATVENSIEELVKSGINFGLIEILISNKTIG